MPHAKPSLDTLFCEAIEMAEDADRTAYLAKACEGDEALRQRVQALVAAHFRSGRFLEQPAVETPDPTGAFVSGEDEIPLTASASEEPGTMIGPYKLLERLGEGGMGVVYVAEQTEPIRRRVALKVIKPGMDTREVVARFEAERQALALMEHPHISKVLDAGATASGRPFFVMELVRGMPITEYCDQARLPAEGRLRLFAKVCRAVQHAHQKGIIHRDLKPSNVLVTLHDGEPVPKVIDFGVAKAVNQRLTAKTVYTRLAQFVGTPMYMAPEQAELSGLDIDTRSDVYSLGVLLYELLTGATPFEPETFRQAGFDEMRRIIREDEPPRPSARVSTLDAAARSTISNRRGLDERQLSRLLRGDLDWIVMCALEKDRTRRYESAGTFATDVERFLADEPVQARPPSAAYRIRKFARRHRAGLTTAAVLSLGLLVVAANVGSSIRDSAIRKAASGQAAEDALADADRWERLGRWSDALAAAERAVAVAGEDPGLRAKVKRKRDDLAMVVRLEEIRLEMAAVKDDRFDLRGGEQAYGEAFRNFGLEIDTLAPGDIDRHLPYGRIRDEMIGALDDWANIRRHFNLEDDSGWRRLLAAARAVDPDPWRDSVRATWELRFFDFGRDGIENRAQWQKRLKAAGGMQGRNDPAALKALADTAPLDRLHPSFIKLFVLTIGTHRPEALAVMRKVQQLRPDDFWLNCDLAQQLAEAQPPNYQEAIGFHRAALALRPNNPGVLVNMSKSLGELGQVDEAVAACERAIRLKPDYAAAHNNLGIALSKKGNLIRAEAAVREAVRLQPDNPQKHYSLGLVHFKQGAMSKAALEFEEAIRLDSPSGSRLSPDYFLKFGNAISNLGRLDEAIAAYRRSIRLKPDYSDAHYNLGNTLLKKGDLPAAAASLREAIRLQSDYAEAHCNLGSTLVELGSHDEAVLEYQKALSLKPELFEAVAGLGKAYWLQKKTGDAITAFRQAVRLKPDNAGVRHFLGGLLANSGQFAEAITVLREAVRLQPDNARTYSNLAAALRGAGQPGEAIVAYRAAIRLNPDFAEANCNLGNLLRSEGQYAEGLKLVRRGHELGTKQARWPYPSAKWLREAEEQADLDRRVLAVLQGQAKVASPSELLQLGRFCLTQKKAPAAAAKLYADAFKAEPDLADDLDSGDLFAAARAAARAGCGQGRDTPPLADLDRARWRTQAVEWLRVDLSLMVTQMKAADGAGRAEMLEDLKRWQREPDLAGIREPAAIANLPAGERETCQKLWAEVAALCKRAQEKAK